MAFLNFTTRDGNTYCSYRHSAMLSSQEQRRNYPLAVTHQLDMIHLCATCRFWRQYTHLYNTEAHKYLSQIPAPVKHKITVSNTDCILSRIAMRSAGIVPTYTSTNCFLSSADMTYWPLLHIEWLLLHGPRVCPANHRLPIAICLVYRVYQWTLFLSH